MCNACRIRYRKKRREALGVLGVSLSATESEIKKAYYMKVAAGSSKSSSTFYCLLRAFHPRSDYCHCSW